jgi:phage baseplate assembly protein W
MITTVKYRDISIGFHPHPNNGDLSVVSNEKSITQSLKTLIFYNYYDVPFQSTLGSNIRAQLFQLMSDITSETIKSDIRLLIENFEPRVEVIDIKSEQSDNKQGINVTLTYRARTSTEEIVVNYFLNRII